MFILKNLFPAISIQALFHLIHSGEENRNSDLGTRFLNQFVGNFRSILIRFLETIKTALETTVPLCSASLSKLLH